MQEPLDKLDKRGRAYHYQFVACSLFALMVAVLGRTIVLDHSIQSDVIAEWLINYEGGFVRRGLVGEVLLMVCQHTSFPIVRLVFSLYWLGAALLSLVLVRMFLCRGWSMFILPFPVCLFVFGGYRFMIARRDAWMLLLAYCTFSLLNSYLRDRQKIKFLVLNLLLILGVLIHEAFFFYVVLLSMTCIIMTEIKEYKKWYKVVFVSLAKWVPFLLVLGALAIYSGSEDVVVSVKASWSLLGEGEIVKGKNPIDFLGVSLDDAIFSTFRYSWLSYARGIPVLPLNLYILIAVYYLVTRLNTINLGAFKLRNVDSVQLSNVLLVQITFLLPMMLFLFADFARALSYWTISSLMAGYWLKERSVFPRFVNRISIFFQERIDQQRWLSNPWTYLVILLTLPVGFHYADPVYMFPIIPLDLKQHLFLSL